MADVRRTQSNRFTFYSSHPSMKLSQTAGFLVLLLISVSVLAQAPKDSSVYLKHATVTEAKGVLHIVSNTPRPLDQVLEAVQNKYGWVVGYEDPQYLLPKDLVDGPSSAGSPSQQLPSGGSFSIEFPANAPDEDKTLHLIVDSYNHSKNPGQFEVRRGPEGIFYVVGVGERDEKGGVAPQSPPLDVQVTLPSEDRSLTDTLDLLCQEITKQSHSDVVVAVSPRSVLMKTNAKIGGSKIPARDLFLQILAATHHKLYWRLLYDPGSKGFFLNVHSLREP